MNKYQIMECVKDQLSQIDDGERRSAIEGILIDPFPEHREWDYAENTKFECWIIAKPDEQSYFAYCEDGFGASSPWGIISVDSSSSIGPDSCWYQFLEDLYIAAGPWGGPTPKNYEIR